MNIQNLMMQARKVQKDIENIQKDLSSTVYDGDSQLVSVKLDGTGKLNSVNIKSEFNLENDKEMLEDMIIIAVNDAVNKMEKNKEEKLGKYNSMFNGLM